MNEQQRFEGAPDPRQAYAGLARWLAEVLHLPGQDRETASTSEISQPELVFDGGYHLQFYQQLPDFIMALLKGDPQADIRYAPLLYHLAGCAECHQGYLELYKALHAALDPDTTVRPPSGTHTFASIPQRMLGHLCQTLISQAEAIQRHTHRGRLHEPAGTEQARSLLQQAIKLSARINQGNIRRQALQDLVRVATLSNGPVPPPEPDIRAYTSTFSLAGGTRRGKQRRITRYPDPLSRPAPEPIYLQSHNLNGRIVQNDGMLELHLQDLDEDLRGHYVTISVLLGSLLEPVRWLGGNPRAIRSSSPVDAQGNLVTPLGQTELRLDDPEEHNLLEAIFLLLEVRAAD